MRAPLVIAAGLLLLVGPASAIFIETPLRLHTDAYQADVGDAIEFRVEPNETNADAWADRQVTAGWATMEDEASTVRDIGVVTLDAGARGSFTFTIPAEADDKNIVVSLRDENGEQLAFAHLAIGDAEPMMMAMSGPGEPEPATGEVDTTPDPTPPAEEPRDAPGFALPLLAAALVVGALALRRRA